MVVAIFRTRVRPEVIDEYQAELTRIRKIAAEQPGFLGAKKYYGDDGDALSIQEWESLDHLKAWRDHPEHAAVRRRGREEFYQDFTVYICDEPRKYDFFREESAAIDGN